MIIETHIHLNHQQYTDLDQVVERATQAGVTHMLDIGCEPHSIEKSIEISKAYPNIKSSIGLHPVDVSMRTDDIIKQIRTLAINEDVVIAIGEIGLDYHWYPEQKVEQLSLFHEQMKIAEELKLPVVIHSRDAYEDCLEVVKQYPSVTGVIHSFSDNYQMAKQFIDQGYYIGIGGPVTFKNGHNQKEVVANIDLSKLVIETDGPYLTPTPFRGKRNEPAYLTYILEQIASIREEEVQTVATTIYENSVKLFKGLINE